MSESLFVAKTLSLVPCISLKSIYCVPYFIQSSTSSIYSLPLATLFMVYFIWFPIDKCYMIFAKPDYPNFNPLWTPLVATAISLSARHKFAHQLSLLDLLDTTGDQLHFAILVCSLGFLSYTPARSCFINVMSFKNHIYKFK